MDHMSAHFLLEFGKRREKIGGGVVGVVGAGKGDPGAAIDECALWRDACVASGGQ